MTGTKRNEIHGNTSWGDLLTNYNGESISYDTIGNPIYIGDYDLDWRGRTLWTISNITTEVSLTFEYNADGIRTLKEVYDANTDNSFRHEYLLNGSQILAEIVSRNDAESVLTFLYYCVIIYPIQELSRKGKLEK